MAQTKPKAGQFYGVSGNGTDGQFLKTDGAGGMSWAAPIVEPTITSIDYPGTATAADPAGGESIIINGTNFQSGITCTVGGTSATTALNSGTQITITSPAKAAGQYTVAVANSDGGTASQANFIQYSGVPIWSTSSGSLGSVTEGASASFQVTATEGSDTIEYAVTTGSLPSGLSLNTNTGAITGTAPSVSTDTTTTFSITATDDENQTSSERSFNITVQNDAPSNYFNTVLYTGNAGGGNTTSQSITSVGFQPDLIWVKNRSNSNNNVLFDSVRAANNWLNSNGTNIEYSNQYTADASFLTNGFTTGKSDQTNRQSDNLVAWNWKAGGAPTATNSAGAGNAPTSGSVMIDGVASTAALAGTIPAKKMSVNTTLGFSIVEYEGNATSGATIAHGLGGDADMVIVKSTNLAQAWNVYVKNVTDADSKYLRLNTTDSIASLSTSNYRFIVNNFSSTVFSVGSDNAVNGNGDDYVAYCFKSTTGFSKVGSYTGNGSSSGPIINLGFEPAFLMIKNTGISTAGSYWAMYDNKRTTSNPRGTILRANDGAGDFSADSLDINFLSNGFQVTGTYDAVNDSGETFVYLAIAADSSTATPSLANSQKTTLFTGRNTTVTGVGFKPDMVILANRAAANGSFLLDSLRGPSMTLWPPGNWLQESRSSVTAFNADGVTIGSYTSIGTGNNVLWSWKAGIIPTINTDGTNSSVVSANQAAGFSIVSFSNNNTTTNTFGHELGGQPELVIIKPTSINANWFVYVDSLGKSKRLLLDTDAAESSWSANDGWNTSNGISSSTISFAYSGTTYPFIAYCFKSIPNYSKVGTYTGTGSSAANTVNIGFAPSFAIIKRTDTTGGWRVFDTIRGTDKSYTLNSDVAEYDDTVNYVDFTSTGFYFSTSQANADINANGGEYIYLAFKQT